MNFLLQIQSPLSYTKRKILSIGNTCVIRVGPDVVSLALRISRFLSHVITFNPGQRMLAVQQSLQPP